MHKNLGQKFARKVFFAVFSIMKRLTIKIVIDVSKILKLFYFLYVTWDLKKQVDLCEIVPDLGDKL